MNKPPHGPEITPPVPELSAGGRYLTPGEARRAARTPEEQAAAERRARRPLLVVATAALAMGLLALTVQVGRLSDQQAVTLDRPWTGRPTLGPQAAPVTVAVYTDYQCPACARFHAETLPALRKRALQGQDVKLVYLHRVLFGPPSTQAATAAECVYRAGGTPAFEKMSALLYAEARRGGEHESGWITAPHLTDLAARSGVPSQTFTSCFEGGAAQREVEAQSQAIAQAGGNSTPGVLVNGHGVLPTLGAIQKAVRDAKND